MRRQSADMKFHSTFKRKKGQILIIFTILSIAIIYILAFGHFQGSSSLSPSQSLSVLLYVPSSPTQMSRVPSTRHTSDTTHKLQSHPTQRRRRRPILQVRIQSPSPFNNANNRTTKDYLHILANPRPSNGRFLIFFVLVSTRGRFASVNEFSCTVHTVAHQNLPQLLSEASLALSKGPELHIYCSRLSPRVEKQKKREIAKLLPYLFRK